MTFTEVHKDVSQIDSSNTWLDYARKLVFETSHSVFLTGKAGTGKSTFLRYTRENCDKKLATLAPTGIAAINVRGETIHSFFQIPLGPLLPFDRRLEKVRPRPGKKKLIKNMELLIIDEISMVRADTIDAIDILLRYWRDNQLPFGGLQLLFVGDLFQLEPVSKKEDWQLLSKHYRTPYFFDAHIFEELDLIPIELEKTYRQKDHDFIHLLDNIRHNQLSYEDITQINRRPSKPPGYDLSYYITLAATRKKVDEINSIRLSELAGEERLLEGVVEGKYPGNSLPTDLKLVLKEKAQVIFIKNDTRLNRRWVNGTIGLVDKIGENTLSIRLEDGRKHEIEPSVWENIKYEYNASKGRIEEKILGTFRQFPVKLAWSITIHKSQGLTFERMILDIGWGAFAAGQLYVALSRCTTLEGLYIRNKIKQRDIIVREEVVEFYEQMNNTQKILKAIEERE